MAFVLVMSGATFASATAASRAASTVRMFEGPVAADNSATLHSLMSGADPASLGLHTPTRVDPTKFGQSDVDRLARQHPAVVSADSAGSVRAAAPNDAPDPPPLTLADCKAAVQAQPAGNDFYVASRYDLCQSDALFVQFLQNDQPIGGLTYVRTVIATAGGSPAVPDRVLNLTVYLDSLAPFGTVDTGMQFIPNWTMTNVSGGTPTISGSNSSWTVYQLEENGTTTNTWTFNTTVGVGVAPDDVDSDLAQFTLGFASGPGWTCTQCDPISTSPMAMRWDDAGYIGGSSGGAIFPYMVALDYSTSGKEKDVANHINAACKNPSSTFPANPSKAVPGCDADHPLHRLDTSSKRYDDNRNAAVATCRAQWGAGYTRGQTLDCDEYPFAATYEGCAQHDYDASAPADNYSAMPLNKGSNRSAGTKLRDFVRWNRILITPTDDGYYVAIDGATSPPPPPPAVDPATVGRINGSIVTASRLDTMTDAELNAGMIDMANLHMTTVVLEASEDIYDLHAGGVPTAAYPNSSGWQRSTQTDVVARLLNAADAEGIHVLMGLPNDDRWLQQVNNATWTHADAVDSVQAADDLWNSYGSHDSFYGWYLPLSVDNVHFGSATAQADLVDYYNTITHELRSITGDLTVATGATFDAVDTTVPGWQDSTAYSSMWQNILPQADLDVVDLQDGIGDQHATTGDLNTWFTAMGNAFTAANRPTELYAGAQTYVTGSTGATTPLGTKTVVSDLNATKAAAYTDWSASYFDYLSSAAPASYTDDYSSTKAYADWAVSGAGDGGDGDVPPTTPTGVTATAHGSQDVTVNWTASTDSKLPIAGYTIIRNGKTVATEIGDALTSFVDQGLAGSTAYTYKIEAFDGAGNISAASASVTATTTATPSAGTDYARCGAATGSPGCSYTVDRDADVPGYSDDLHTKLTDGVLGTAALGSAWQGRDFGSYAFTVDLGAAKTITQIASDWLQLRQDAPWDSVNLPTGLTFYTSTDGTNWTETAVADQPSTSPVAQTKTYKAVNLTAVARYVKVAVTAGPGWTMTDELQINGA